MEAEESSWVSTYDKRTTPPSDDNLAPTAPWERRSPRLIVADSPHQLLHNWAQTVTSDLSMLSHRIHIMYPFVSIYLYIYTFIHINIHTHTYRQIHTYIYMYMYIYIRGSNGCSGDQRREWISTSESLHLIEPELLGLRRNILEETPHLQSSTPRTQWVI